jgi:hypothetical protein
MATGKSIGEKYGKSTGDYATASKNAAEQVLLNWGNESIALMKGVIIKKARTGQASTLASSMSVDINERSTDLSLKIVSTENYSDFVDKGVKGLRKNKTKNSPYKFKSIGVSPKMVESFKEYIARTGLKTLKNKSGKPKKLIIKDKKKQADLITQAATQLAVATKIGGIKPMNYKAAALSKKRVNKLSKELASALGEVIKINLTKK